jgi:hypothetical protein
MNRYDVVLVDAAPQLLQIASACLENPTADALVVLKLVVKIYHASVMLVVTFNLLVNGGGVTNCCLACECHSLRRCRWRWWRWWRLVVWQRKCVWCGGSCYFLFYSFRLSLSPDWLECVHVLTTFGRGGWCFRYQAPSFLLDGEAFNAWMQLFAQIVSIEVDAPADADTADWPQRPVWKLKKWTCRTLHTLFQR